MKTRVSVKSEDSSLRRLFFFLNEQIFCKKAQEKSGKNNPNEDKRRWNHKNKFYKS